MRLAFRKTCDKLAVHGTKKSGRSVFSPTRSCYRSPVSHPPATRSSFTRSRPRKSAPSRQRLLFLLGSPDTSYSSARNPRTNKLAKFTNKLYDGGDAGRKPPGYRATRQRTFTRSFAARGDGRYSPRSRSFREISPSNAGSRFPGFL